jgi:hypothetical protein
MRVLVSLPPDGVSLMAMDGGNFDLKTAIFAQK